MLRLIDRSKGEHRMRIRRRIKQRLAKLRFLLGSGHRRYRSLSLEQVRGHEILVLPDVFNPALFPTGEVLLDALGPVCGKRVLDMGTGAGLCAVATASEGADVLAVDLNPEAVRCVGINTRLNRVEDRVRPLQSDLFSEVVGVYDIVLFNPPYFGGVAQDPEDLAWRNEGVLDRFLDALPEHLAPGGYALVLTSDIGVARVSADRLGGLSAEAVLARDVGTEVLTVTRIGR